MRDEDYYHGRTETIRSCTAEAVHLAKAFLDEASPSEKAERLARAAKRHVEVAKGAAAASGPSMGVDRHLFALKRTAEVDGMELPTLFKDSLFNRSSTWILSTSNVSDPNIELFGFGAVAASGYGIGYQVLDDHVPLCVSSYRSDGDTNSNDFVDAVAETLEEFHRVHEASA